MTTRPTWSVWFERNTAPSNRNDAPPVPSLPVDRDSYYQSSEYGDHPNNIPLRSSKSYYGERVDDDLSASTAHESNSPFINYSENLAQEHYYKNGPSPYDQSSLPRGSSIMADRSSSAITRGSLPPQSIQMVPVILVPGDKPPLDPEIQQRPPPRRLGRPWLNWTLVVIMTCVMAYELYRNKVLTGNLIETGKGGQAFNIMIGPAAPILINVGARFAPCMHPTNFTDANFPCLNATDLISPSGQTSDPNQICSLESWCGLSGFQNGVPNQWYRFITPLFIHGGVVHLVANMVVQITICAQLERDHGPIRFAIIYFLSGIMGFIFGGNFAPVKNTAMGASGAIFGGIGCLLVEIIVNWRQISRPLCELIKLLVMVIITFVVGLLPWFDNFSHIGGFFTGVLSGILFMRFEHTSRTHRAGIWIARCIALPLIIIAMTLGILNFEKSADPAASCSWCRYFSCLPINGWCDAFNN